MNNVRVQRMIREIENDPAFQLFDRLFGALQCAMAFVAGVSSRRRYLIPLLAD